MRKAAFRLLAGSAALLAAPALAERLDLAVAEAEAGIDAYTGMEVLVVRLAPASRKALAAFTRNHVSKAVDLYIDGEHIMTVVVMGPIEGGEIQISSSAFPEREGWEALAERLAGESAHVWMVVKE